MIHSLRALDTRLSVVFNPPVIKRRENLDLVRTRRNIYTDKVDDDQQLLAACRFSSADRVGQDVCLYGRFAPFLVEHELGLRRALNPWLDYKAFATNGDHWPETTFSRVSNVFDVHDAPSVVADRGPYDNPAYIQNSVEQWCARAVGEYFGREERTRVFRRSLIIGFVSLFSEFGKESSSGHEIAIAMEVSDSHPDLFKFYIVERIMHEYVFSVHDRLFQFMANGLRSSPRFDEKQHLITNRLVCVKDRIRVDSDFMMCMSVAYRVAAMLSYVEDIELIRETDEEFEQSRKFLMHHTFRMINWLTGYPDIALRRLVALVSSRMAERFYELEPGGMHIVLVPFDAPVRGGEGEQRFRYSVEKEEFVEIATVRCVFSDKP